jgi:hypothetical protein
MKLRRIIAVILVVLGGVLIYLAPETLDGFILIGMGVVIEAVGIFLEHRR